MKMERISPKKNILAVPFFRETDMHDIRDGLVLDLDFGCISGSKIYDISGKENHGSINGAQAVDGLGNSRALSFDGVDDYVDCGNIFTANQTELAVEVLVYIRAFNQPDATQTATPLISNWNAWDPGGQEGYMLRAFHFSINYTEWHFIICDGTGYDKVTYGYQPDADFNDEFQNRWLHIVGTFKADSYIRFYLDGVLKDSVTSGVPSQMDPDLNKKDWIARCGVNANYTDALFSLARVYNRALSGQEIKRRYDYIRWKSGLLI